MHTGRMRRCSSLGIIALAWLAHATSASAYSLPEAFRAPADIGGGGGRWFTGSPAEGFGCSVCHTPDSQLRRFPLRVSGLPAAGYQPSSQYEIVLDWPEFAQRWREEKPDPTRAAVADAPVPGIGLVAEFVAESGKASGVIEIEAAKPSPEERCELVRANLVPRLAAQLVQVRPAVDSIAIKPGDDGRLRCESRQLGQRCLIALSSCGAQRIRLRWTAPAQREGPIWFSAGFVASEAVSGTVEHDSVHEFTLPVLVANAASGRYSSKLTTSCAAVSGARGAPLSAVWLWACAMLCCVRGKRRAALLSVVIGLAVGAACGQQVEADIGAAPPLAGLYTQGSTLGASDPTDQPQPKPSAGDRCKPFTTSAVDGGVAAAGEASPGMLRIQYSTQSTGGAYAPKNCGAVWIESADGRYVATLEIRAALRRPALVYLREHACEDQSGPDVMSAATAANHERPHMLTWSGKDFGGVIVPDAQYKLFIESTETDKAPGELEVFEFSKGRDLLMLQPTLSAEGPVSALTLIWRPSSGAVRVP